MNTDLLKDSKILIVEDNPTNIKLLSFYFDSFGSDVLVAKCGESALEIAFAEIPDIVLLDIMMPKMNGYEVCEKLKEDDRTRDIPVIFISALKETTDKVKGFESGGVDFISKPFQKREVLARVTAHLMIRRQQIALQNEISERKKAEEKIKKTSEELQISNATKDKLFSIIAHDLKSPFTSLLGFSDYLIQDIDDLDQEEIIEVATSINNSARGIYALLENLLHWSRLQTGRIQFDPEPVDLKELVQDSVGLLALNARKKNIELRNEVPENTEVFVDKTLADTVFRNLFSNAIKFTTNAGAVTVSTKKLDDDFLEVTVADTGVGIPDDKLQKLFKLDEKVTSPGTAKEKGTGLGLILCKEFVEKNGGTLRVESEIDKGSKFIFTMPLRKLDFHS